MYENETAVTEERPALIVIGVGNILFGDEGIGCFAAKYLSENYRFTPAIDVMDGATLGFKLMTYLQDYHNMIILDTVSIEDAPGSIYRLPKDELLGLGSYRKTAHEIEVVEMLEITSMLEECSDVTIIGIVPQNIESIGIGMTKELEAAFSNFIEVILKEISSHGVEFEKVANKTLEEIYEIDGHRI